MTNQENGSCKKKNWLIEGKSTKKSPETVYGRKTSYNNLG